LATRECFQSLKKEFEVGSEKSQELKASLVKSPGILSFQAYRSDKPSDVLEGAKISIEGQEIGQTPLDKMEVNPGRRIIEIQADKYQSYQSEVEIEGCDKHQELNVALIPAWSEIAVNSVPSGATLTVDGKLAGSTPLKFEALAGDHELVLKADGFKPWRSRIAVKANHPQQLETIRLQPADGTLTVQTKPAGANVMLDSNFAGQTPLKIPISADTLHRIHISKAGYEKASRKVTLKREESKTISVTLKAKLGVINLSVTPPDANIIVDGKSAGKVPRQLRLVAIEHQLEITKKGYQSYRTRITPRPGFPQEIQVSLTKRSAAKKTTANIIRAKNGYELRLIRPQAFTMGSSRREQGRRSNETLRNVKLQRPFYIGTREVTNKEFRQFRAAHNSGAFKSLSLNQEEQPVVAVTWVQAALFCNWLSARESLPPAYMKDGTGLKPVDPIGTGYRLPTEAEWEYCARFNGNKAGLKYPWGNTFPPEPGSGNFADVSAKELLPLYLKAYDDGFPVSAPPAKFKANGLDLYDMGGNAAEWCHDYYSIYTYDAGKISTDPAGPKNGKHRVIRGSSWQQASISALRLSYRDYSNTKRPDLGFRICRYAK
ncbi:MAG: PEGA domain-containing protein, partial [Deltaproteobacteria bacterium]|nr:PEGA domain-containing protein [Deltaproteobacteria bacterium]